MGSDWTISNDSRLLTDNSGPLPDVEEGAIGWPVPWVAKRSEKDRTAEEVVADMGAFVEFVKDVAGHMSSAPEGSEEEFEDELVRRKEGENKTH